MRLSSMFKDPKSEFNLVLRERAEGPYEPGRPSKTRTACSQFLVSSELLDLTLKKSISPTLRPTAIVVEETPRTTFGGSGQQARSLRGAGQASEV